MAAGWAMIPYRPMGFRLKVLRLVSMFLASLTVPGVSLRSLAISVTAVISACDGCSHVPEPPLLSSTTRPIVREAAASGTIVPAILAQRPHDPSAFTQGLLFANGVFLESTGGYGASSLRRVDPATGHILVSLPLAKNVFGEGLARLHRELFQLTWREHRCFVYDEATFEKRREMAYEGEGWGLTSDGEALIMSDGSAVLRFLEPGSLGVVRTINVHEGTRKLDRLNELEWVHGEILANLWGSTAIARIDPRSGEVLGRLDLSRLPEPHHDDPDAVLNGIAYDEPNDRLFVTGKRWGSVFEIARPGR
jgi:glutamine cyclotransferase